MEPRTHTDLDSDTVIGVAFRRSLIIASALLVLVVTTVAMVRFARPGEKILAKDLDMTEPIPGDGVAVPALGFTDVTTRAGITYRHVNGAAGEKLLPETMGSGVAVFDYDNDDDQDLLFVNSDVWPWNRPVAHRPTMALYANDGNGHFVDVTTQVGLDLPIYGMGAAVADVNDDGNRDLFIAALGRNRLFLNRNGRFMEVTGESGVGGSDTAWSTSAGFFDADNDGDLDLFVDNYVAWSRETDFEVGFTLNGTDRAYGPPNSFAGTYPYLYRNDGVGHFEEMGFEAGIHVINPATGEAVAKGLGVTFADVDGNGRLDIMVANDTVRNFLFLNRSDWDFEEVGTVAGVAFDSAGRATGAMGIDVADYRDDGHLAFAICNFSNEMASLYVAQESSPHFADEAMLEGIGSPSRLRLGFGAFFFDADLDGRLDLLFANGHLEESISQVQASQRHRQPAQLFWNTGRRVGPTFASVSPNVLRDLATPIVGRGAAYGDFDGDGDLDVVLTANAGPPLLLRNDHDAGHHWLRVTLAAAPPNRDAVGAWAEVVADGRRQRRQVMPTRSYLSQVELPITFGLGPSDEPVSVTVRWPDGSTQLFEGLDVDRAYTLHQATGRYILTESISGGQP